MLCCSIVLCRCADSPPPLSHVSGGAFGDQGLLPSSSLGVVMLRSWHRRANASLAFQFSIAGGSFGEQGLLLSSSRGEVKLWDVEHLERGAVKTWEGACSGRFNHQGERRMQLRSQMRGSH